MNPANSHHVGGGALNGDTHKAMEENLCRQSDLLTSLMLFKEKQDEEQGTNVQFYLKTSETCLVSKNTFKYLKSDKESDDYKFGELKVPHETYVLSIASPDMKNISDAVKIFKKRKCSFELMHCVSTYPMKDDTANLNMINVLKKKFKCNVGYSGHENGLVISIAASAFGLSSLERHITLDRTMYGSDQSASIEPNGLTSLISAVRKIEKALGNGKKVFLPEEKIISKKLRAHL